MSGLRRTRPPAVFLHIGEPKTGTTYLQDILWRNRDTLARAGVTLPGLTPVDQFRAMQDLRGIPPEHDDPMGSWIGDWDVLAAQAAHPRGGTAVISQESIGAATPSQVQHAVTSLAGTELHVVLTVRDFAGLLPAEWQETVKHRRSLGWEAWLDRVRSTEPVPGTRPDVGFWRSHDTPSQLALWSRFVAPHRIHVVTVPPRSSGPQVLWQRFAALLGVEDIAVAAGGTRRNPSLGLAETEFLRTLNLALVGRIPNWFYADAVKQALAHEILTERVSSTKVRLPDEHRDWVQARTSATISYLETAGHEVIGDLHELRPSHPLSSGSMSSPGSPAVADEQVDAAVRALAGLIARDYRRRRVHAWANGPADLALAWVQASPRLRAALRRLSARPALHRARLAGWRLHDSRTAHRAVEDLRSGTG